MDKSQREYVLRRQLDAIRKELGDEDGGDDTERYRERIAETPLSDEARKEAERELGRLQSTGPGHPEASTIRTYLDWLLSLPWGKESEDQDDVAAAGAVLEADHAGLEEVKERILEYLAVRSFRRKREIEDEGGGAILCLVGPPGVGKTSLGESIARSLGREFVRMSLGGIRDEAEIRGHRRTYIGALPGRLVRALRDAGTMNPVILLDEVDKLGADWRGDPSSALLEVLDPAQNSTFRDHYLDLKVDLSQGALHRHGERRRADPRGALRPPRGHPHRRLHRGREGRHRGPLPRAAGRAPQRAPAGGGRDRGRGAAAHRHRVHARGRRPQRRAPDPEGAAQDRQEARRGSRRRRSPSSPATCASCWAARGPTSTWPGASRSPASPRVSR